MTPVMRRIAAPLFGLALVWSLGTVARADEFHLNDGSKIVGSIVGYENGSFKVQTSYGFAMVRKDSIIEIVVSEKAPPLPAPATPAFKPAALSEPSYAKQPVLPMPAPRLKPARAEDKSPSAVPDAAPLVSVPVLRSTALSLSAISEFLDPAESLDARALPIEETVRGNVYVNQSYGFQMYKPPAWDVIKNPQKQLPNAVGALGTQDQTTLLVIGRDLLSDSIQDHAATTERALRDVYTNFRPLDSKRITIAGLPAIEERFYGSLDDRDWSVTVTTVGRNKEVFTILGMTSANSDLIQIQENVIAKTISSLQFISPAITAAPPTSHSERSAPKRAPSEIAFAISVGTCSRKPCASAAQSSPSSLGHV